ncbi:MAG: OmpH family outer membrane protein [Bacteroidales bacterium]|jgi:outer membrane protein|nr:OmpH family outer membrane protein [Bacteroidales bacterium]
MKRNLILLAVVMLMGITAGHAQKYGHVNANEIFLAMPGADTLQTALQAYQSELEAEYTAMMTEFQTKYEKFNKEAGTMSSTVRAFREKELTDAQERISTFEQSLQDMMQEKQIELMTPFQDKIIEAIQAVAKENGYAYIFDSKNLLYSDGGDDVSALVKKKLGITK